MLSHTDGSYCPHSWDYLRRNLRCNNTSPYSFDNRYERLAVNYIDRRKGDKWFNFFHFMIDLEGGPCLIKRLTRAVYAVSSVYTQHDVVHFLIQPLNRLVIEKHAIGGHCKMEGLAALFFSSVQELQQEFDELENAGAINTPCVTFAKKKRTGEIKALCLHICNDCNLRCQYCFADEGTYHTTETDCRFHCPIKNDTYCRDNRI